MKTKNNTPSKMQMVNRKQGHYRFPKHAYTYKFNDEVMQMLSTFE